MTEIRYLTCDIPITDKLQEGIKRGDREALLFYEQITGIVQMNDTPIKDNFDLWRAIDAAEQQMDTVITDSNKYKYIRESQRKANKAIFGNLKTLIMDYANKAQEG